MAFSEAKELYEEWHDFESEDTLDIDIPEPKGDLKYDGLLKRLDYMSPKWEREEVYYYHHFRKGWPRLYHDRNGNYFIYGYIRITPDGIDDWLKTQIFEWKRPNVKKGVSKLGVLQLLAYEDPETGKTETKMFGDRYYVGNPSKDFTYISAPMRENPRSKPIAVRQLEMIVNDIRKDKNAMKVLERALGNLPHRNPIPIPTQAIAANAFLKSIVTGVSTATFGVGITATILGSLLVNFLLNTIKNKVSPPTMPPPPKWVMNMTKSYVAAGVKDPKDITDRIQEIWNQQTFESKVGIYEGETGKVEEEDDEGEDVEEPDVGGVEATENPDKTTKVFVYGSLRKGGWNEHRFYGERPMFPGAIKTEKGTIKGELRAFNMPAVDTKGEGTVIGEMVTFDERFTPEVMKQLDGFERSYNRLEVEVTLEDGRKETAWVYEVKHKGEGSDWYAAGRWGAPYLIRHGDYIKFVKEDAPKHRIEMDRERKREEPYKEFLGQSKHGPQLLMEHEEWKVRKAESGKEEELRRDEETLRMYGHRMDNSEENPDKKQYTEDELIQKALEMTFRWAYNRAINNAGEAHRFFTRKGIKIAYVAVQDAFTSGKRKRHKDDAKKGGGGDLPYIANPIKSKAQWRLFKARYPEMFERWQRSYPARYGDLPERAEENPLNKQEISELESLRDTFLEEMDDIDMKDPAEFRRHYYLRRKAEVINDVVRTYDGGLNEPEEMGASAEKRANPLEYHDYKEAIEGEGWAIGDYAAMIAEADTEKERWMLNHIRKEEQEHLDELVELMECKKAPRSNPTANTVETVLDPTRRDGR
jgi:gamma-glutamylcyclotransferase (GGCT)/AIG2-like uncharacterized protein YtfP